jgi:hypothetical protein
MLQFLIIAAKLPARETKGASFAVCYHIRNPQDGYFSWRRSPGHASAFASTC